MNSINNKESTSEEQKRHDERGKSSIYGLTYSQVEEHIARGELNVSVESPSKTEKEIIISNICTYFNLIFAVISVLLIIVGSYRDLTFLPIILTVVTFVFLCGMVAYNKDSTGFLKEFSLEQVEEAGWKLLGSTFDLHHDSKMNEGNIMTEYEEKFSSMGNPIHKLVATRIS